MAIIIEEGSVHDLSRAYEIFRSAVHAINNGDYTKEQVEAWAPLIPNVNRWEKRMRNNTVLLAKEGENIIGFAEYKKPGIIDMLYIHSDYLNRGAASALLSKIDSIARSEERKTLSGFISITARTYFEKHGFEVSWDNKVEKDGQMLRNFLMIKQL